MMVHLIHGIHPKQPGGTVAKLKPFFQRAGHFVYTHEYGSAYALTARFLNPGRADYIKDLVAPDGIIVGHSNGCAIAHLIQKKHRVKGLILINPALDDDATFTNVEWVHVYHNWGDQAVPLSENVWFWLTRHPWGAMGQRGYTGNDPRVTNFNCCDKAEIVLPCVDGHSDLFEPGKIEAWSEYMIRNMEHANAVRSVT